MSFIFNTFSKVFFYEKNYWFCFSNTEVLVEVILFFSSVTANNHILLTC